LILTVFAAVFFVGLVISFQQLWINVNTPFQKWSFLGGMVLSAVLGIGFAGLFAKKMREKQNEMKELKKKYVQVED